MTSSKIGEGSVSFGNVIEIEKGFEFPAEPVDVIPPRVPVGLQVVLICQHAAEKGEAVVRVRKLQHERIVPKRGQARSQAFDAINAPYPLLVGAPIPEARVRAARKLDVLAARKMREQLVTNGQRVRSAPMLLHS